MHNNTCGRIIFCFDHSIFYLLLFYFYFLGLCLFVNHESNSKGKFGNGNTVYLILFYIFYLYTQDKKKRAVFTVNEIEILIQLWGDSGIQKKFSSSVRHNVIWEEIASQMREFGFDRNYNELKSKINNLKTEYRKLKPSSGIFCFAMNYCNEINLIFFIIY